MKILSVLIISFLITLNPEPKTYSITVTIDNITSEDGQILVSLSDETTFMKKSIKNKGQAANAKNQTYTFTDVPAGDYAILVLHDKNSNNRMDYTTNGLPLEPYTTTGDVPAYGPPTFELAKFTVDNEDLELNLRF